MTADEEVQKPPTLTQRVIALEEENRIRAKVEAERRSAHPPMTEARALDACMDALFAMREQERSRSRNDYGYLPMVSSTGHYEPSYDPNDSVSRVLRHLAERFGVVLVERRTAPCSRPHADNLDPHWLTQAIADAAHRSERAS